jgi:hypothetical protein
MVLASDQLAALNVNYSRVPVLEIRYGMLMFLFLAVIIPQLEFQGGLIKLFNQNL